MEAVAKHGLQAGAISVVAYVAPYGGLRYLFVTSDAAESLLPIARATYKLVEVPETLAWLRRRELWQFAGIAGVDAGPPLEPGRYRVFGEDLVATIPVPRSPVLRALGELDCSSHAIRGQIVLNCYSRREFFTLQDEYVDHMERRAAEVVCALALARGKARPLSLFEPTEGGARWDAVQDALVAIGEPPLAPAPIAVLRGAAESRNGRADAVLPERWWGTRVVHDERLLQRAHDYADGRRQNTEPGAPTEERLGQIWWAGEAMMDEIRHRYESEGDK